MNNYYVWWEYEEDGYFENYDSVFEALADYYQAIIDGPNAAGTDPLVEMEFGEMFEEDFFPQQTHEF